MHYALVSHYTMVDIHLVSSILVIINNAEVNILALAGVAHWIECECVNQRVAGSIRAGHMPGL